MMTPHGTMGIVEHKQANHQYIKILVVCDGCGRGRNGFAGRVQKHHVRFSFHRRLSQKWP